MQLATTHNIEGNTTEDNWLDITYTTRKYIEEKTSAVKPKRRRSGGGAMQLVALAVVCLAILSGAFFLSADNGVMSMVKTTYLSTFNNISSVEKVNDLTLPYNVNVTAIDSGVVTFSGGNVLLSFTEGTVSEVKDGTITVAVDEDTTMQYTGVVECYVVEGDSVNQYDVLAKYTESATVTIAYMGEPISNVVASQYLLQWSV